MDQTRREGVQAQPAHVPWRNLWARIALEGAGLVITYFVAWELAESSAFDAFFTAHLHVAHIVRGVGAALMLGTWSFLRIRSARLASEAAIAGQMALLEERVRERVAEHENLEAQLRHQEKMAALGVLAAGFAHDVGNPLASLSTELELLEGEDDIATIRESLGVLRRHVSRIGRTLREMVDFARRRRDGVTDVCVASAVADSVRLVQHDTRWKRVELAVAVPDDLPPVRMVEDHLVLVLVNLMLNAADAMPEGGKLEVSARDRAGDVELHVRDTGHGMSKEVLAGAKAPLFTTKGATRGTGLGLAVSDSIVRSLGGTLDLTSAVGEGTDVMIRFPAHASEVSDG